MGVRYSLVMGVPSPEPDGRLDATRLLHRVGEGDSSAAAELLPLVYDELRTLAQVYFRGQRRDHTLQPTALVHEAFLKLVRSPDAEWNGRAHFCAVAATAMRQILKNHARDRSALKRGGGAKRVPLSQVETPSGGDAIDAEALEAALERLDALNPRQSRIVELWFFGGLTMEQIAGVLGVSTRTVERDWRQARAWLNRELQEGGGA